MEIRPKRPFTANLPLGGSHNFHAGFDVATGRSSDLQAWPIEVTGFLLTHLPGFRENQCSLGVRSCLPLRGSPGFAPGSLETHPGARHQQTNHKIERCSLAVNRIEKPLSAQGSNFHWYNKNITKWLYRLYHSRRTIALHSSVRVAISNCPPFPVSARGVPRRMM